MPYRRKKTTSKRKRSYRKRAIPRSIAMASRTFAVKQKTYLDTWTFSSASTAGFWRYYTILPGTMNNFAEHAAVFDEYKITRITMEFRPQWDNFSPDNTLWSSGSVHTVVDPSSYTSPTGAYSSATLNAFLEQGNVKSQRFGTTISKSFKPKVAAQVSGGGLAGRLISAPWLRTDDTSVTHRGMHIYLQQNDSTLLPVKYDVFVTHHITFRGHR